MTEDVKNLRTDVANAKAAAVGKIAEPNSSIGTNASDNSVSDADSEGTIHYVEWCPNHRYGKFADILGRGSSKVVNRYLRANDRITIRAFDTELGIEVAWNQIELTGVPNHVREKLKG